MIPLMMQKDYKPQGWRKFQYQNQDFLGCLQHRRHATNTGTFCW